MLSCGLRVSALATSLRQEGAGLASGGKEEHKASAAYTVMEMGYSVPLVSALPHQVSGITVVPRPLSYQLLGGKGHRLFNGQFSPSLR